MSQILTVVFVHKKIPASCDAGILIVFTQPPKEPLLLHLVLSYFSSIIKKYGFKG